MTWPKSFKDQKAKIAELTEQIASVKRRQLTLTHYSNTAPTSAEYNTAWDTASGGDLSPDELVKLLWYAPTKSAIQNVYQRLGTSANAAAMSLLYGISDFEFLGRVSLSQRDSAETITFSSISQAYSALMVIFTTRGLAAGHEYLVAQMNGITAGYFNKYISNFRSGIGTPFLGANQTGAPTNGFAVGYHPGLNEATINAGQSGFVFIPFYADTDQKTTLSMSTVQTSVLKATLILGGHINTTAPITSLILQGQTTAELAKGSYAVLYGLR